jgi:hypothetical protein
MGLLMINKFFLEPTDENLERLKKGKGKKVYWHTADFFLFDPNLADELSSILDAYMEKLMESEEEDEDEAIHKIEFSIGRMIVKAAKKRGISSQDYREQFNNFSTVIWTPICIWRKDESGKISYSLSSNL